ncbi:MAG: PA0069 family radical SAM protein [Planktomarina sp.]
MFYIFEMIRFETNGQVTPKARGRGVSGNSVGRFERLQRVATTDGWSEPDGTHVVRTETRIEMARKIISRNTSPDLPFDRSINPYRGCEHGCVYCFARPSHAYLNMSPGLDFETKLIARPNAADLLRKELSNPKYVPDVLAVGTNTDPYQPIENDHRIMRRCLKVMQEFQHPVAIVTKGTLIERDIDILADMAARGLARVGISLTSLDPVVSRKMEPRVPGPQRALRTIKMLKDAGIPVRVMIAPVVPGLTDHELEGILKAAKGAGATSATWIMLRLPREVAGMFVDWLRQNFPNHASKVMARVRESHDGRDYDPDWGKRMRGEGPYAELIAQRFKVACARLNLNEEQPPLRTDLFQVPPKRGDQLSLF